MIKNQIETYRRSVRLAKSELARRVGVCPSYVTMLEKNERQPSIEIAFKIADCLKCKFEDLFVWRGSTAKR